MRGMPMLLAVLASAACARPHGTLKTESLPPCAQCFGEGTLIDLTHPFDAATLYWPGESSGFVLTSEKRGQTPGGYFYAANSFCAPEHGGTHLDAPNHFAEAGLTTDKVPLGQLIAPAVLIDLSPRAAADSDTLLTPADIAAFEQAHGSIAPQTIVLVRTDWSKRWPDRRAYFGDDTPGDATNLHFPGVSQEAAQVLVAKGVAAVGIDTASIDYGPSSDFMAHRVLNAANVPVFENLTKLDQLPVRGALVIALPIKISGGSGGPLRAIALLPAELSPRQ